MRFMTFVVSLIVIHTRTESTVIKGSCGFPGKPINSRLLPDSKQVYQEGEEVSYECDDYWFYFQSRKCVNGSWTGRPARCAKTIPDNDVVRFDVVDITNPNSSTVVYALPVALNKTVVDFPNSFVSKRLRPKLVKVSGSGRFRWTLTFERAQPFQFVHLSIAYINHTFLEPSVKESLSLNISLTASPNRHCALEFLSDGAKWWENGIRVDAHFVCDSVSQAAYEDDLANPGNTLTFETHVSADIHYYLTAVFLGRPYGTASTPECGEPETPFAMNLRTGKPNRDYTFYCKASMKYVSTENADLPGTNIHKKRCGRDMIWYGSYPICEPLKPCGVEELFDELGNGTEIVLLDQVYFFNQSRFYAIEGSKVSYGCQRNDQILIGKDERVCLKNGTWSHRHPRCFSPDEEVQQLSSSTSSSLLLIIAILSGIFFIILVATCFIFCYLINNRRRRESISQKNYVSTKVSEAEMYDDIGAYDYKKDEDDTYQAIDENVRYYTQPRFVDSTYIETAELAITPLALTLNAAKSSSFGQLSPSPLPTLNKHPSWKANLNKPQAQTSDDYWRIPAYSYLAPSQPMPDYLEMISTPRSSVNTS